MKLDWTGVVIGALGCFFSREIISDAVVLFGHKISLWNFVESTEKIHANFVARLIFSFFLID